MHSILKIIFYFIALHKNDLLMLAIVLHMYKVHLSLAVLKHIWNLIFCFSNYGRISFPDILLFLCLYFEECTVYEILFVIVALYLD